MYIAIISSNSYAVFNLCGHCPLPLELYAFPTPCAEKWPGDHSFSCLFRRYVPQIDGTV